MSRPIVYHIPVCPFSQRVEILLELKGLRDRVDFHVVDITTQREAWLLEKSRGSTMLPILETEAGGIIKESMVILRYVENRFPEPAILRPDPFEHAIEGMLTAMEGEFGAAGYLFVMNQQQEAREKHRQRMIEICRRLDDFLREHSANGTWLFDRFGFAETVFMPLFKRFRFLDYFEDFRISDLPGLERLAHWEAACLSYPGAQQVSDEQVIKLYYDYARGAGNGALPAGRKLSSFVFEPHWSQRPWPPKDKYRQGASDAELGLISA